MRAKKSQGVSQEDPDTEAKPEKDGPLEFTPPRFHLHKYDELASLPGSGGLAQARSLMRALRAIGAAMVAHDGVGQIRMAELRKALTTPARRGRRAKYTPRHLRTLIDRMLTQRWLTLHRDVLHIPYWAKEPTNPTALDYQLRKGKRAAGNAARQRAFRAKQKGKSLPMSPLADVELERVCDTVTRLAFNTPAEPSVKKISDDIDGTALQACDAFTAPPPAPAPPATAQEPLFCRGPDSRAPHDEPSNTRARRRYVVEESDEEEVDYMAMAESIVANRRAQGWMEPEPVAAPVAPKPKPTVVCVSAQQPGALAAPSLSLTMSPSVSHKPPCRPSASRKPTLSAYAIGRMLPEHARWGVDLRALARLRPSEREVIEARELVRSAAKRKHLTNAAGFLRMTLWNIIHHVPKPGGRSL